MRAIGAFLRVLTLLVIVCAAGDADVPIPPAPAQWATDTAGLLSPQTIADLNARLSTYERQSGHQVLVYVGTTTAPTPTEDWTVRAFEHWKVGRKGLDDGVVFFVFPRDRTARIEVGYGLEQTLPDVVASRIIRETIVPDMRLGRPDRAVISGVDRILGVLGGKAELGPSPSLSPPAQDTGSDDISTPFSPLALIFIGLAILAFLIVAVRSPSTALFLLFTVMGRGSGGSIGGGGFSGGGGRSGGGGATGRW